jgi:hypothetical protein
VCGRDECWAEQKIVVHKNGRAVALQEDTNACASFCTVLTRTLSDSMPGHQQAVALQANKCAAAAAAAAAAVLFLSCR